MEINQFVVVTDDPEFCLGTTLLYIDTRNIWLIWRLQRPQFHDMPQISCSTWCEIQTIGFVNAIILSQRKVEREVNLKMAEEIKVGGESSWCQGDCKPNRTRTVTAILESAMNKEEGQEERLSEHQFS